MDTPTDVRRAFDFWLGTWDVFAPDGTHFGTNRIEALHDGTALAEHWEGAGGVRGTSLNAVDPATGRWHQTWVDSTGSLLLLDGGPSDGGMVLEGVAPADDDPGRLDRQRITWAPLPDGVVRQHWEVSSDDGRSWRTAFDGRYRRRG